MSITSYPELVRLSTLGNTVKFGGPTVDSFGRLRTSTPFTLFDSQNRYAADDQFFTTTATSGSTTFLTNESSVRMDVTADSGSEVVRQTYRVFPYQPGKSLLVLATFVMNSAKTNLRQRVGYFNSDNGVFLQQDGSTVSFVLRSYIGGSSSDARTVNKADWNGDKLDGTGPSRKTLDLTKAQILFLDFEWLGVGSVRCGFVIDGEFIVAHTFHNANSITSVYMTTAMLPVRYEIKNTAATASASSMKQVCSSVMSEGGYEKVTVESVARRTTALSSISTTFLPLVSIRLNSSKLGAVIIVSKTAVIPTASQNYEIALLKNATLTSASYNTSTFSNVDFDVSATAVTGGTIVRADYVSSTNQSTAVYETPAGYNFDLQLGVDGSNVSDVYTLAIRTLDGATSGTAYGAISFYDLT